MAALEWGHRLAFTGATHQALKLLQPDIPAVPEVSSIEPLRARRLLWLADCYREIGEYRLAEDSYDRAIEAYRALGGGQPLVVLSVAYNSKALLLLRQKRFAEAEPLFRRAIAGYVEVGYVSESPALAAARVELAWALSSLGRDAEARDLVESAGPTVARELAPSHVARVLLRKLRALKKDRMVTSG
jgi:tetratricopeptide (TPR) repeat protein